MPAVFSSESSAATGLITSPQARVLVSGGAIFAGDRFKPATLPSLCGFYGACRRIALILHATHPDDRDATEQRFRAAFGAVNPKAELTSLHHYDRPDALQFLSEADGIFIGGGETFGLLRALYAAGQIEMLRERVLAGVPTGGTSAGANVMGPLIGTTNDFPVTDVPTRRALSVFPTLINPHHPLPSRANDFETRAAKIGHYLQWNPGERVLALADASTAILAAGRVSVALGPAWLYEAGALGISLREGDLVSLG